MSAKDGLFESGSPTAVFARGPILKDLLARSILLEEDWEAVPADVRNEPSRKIAADKLLARLVELHLLTEYQAARVGAGRFRFACTLAWFATGSTPSEYKLFRLTRAILRWPALGMGRAAFES